MKKPLLALAHLATGAALLLLATGCHTIDPKLVAAMAGDNAHLHARVTTLYGTIEFERKMDFAPEPVKTPEPPRKRAKRILKPAAADLDGSQKPSEKPSAPPADPSLN